MCARSRRVSSARERQERIPRGETKTKTRPTSHLKLQEHGGLRGHGSRLLALRVRPGRHRRRHRCVRLPILRAHRRRRRRRYRDRGRLRVAHSVVVGLCLRAAKARLVHRVVAGQGVFERALMLDEGVCLDLGVLGVQRRLSLYSFARLRAGYGPSHDFYCEEIHSYNLTK